jgi:hypothetical protein
MQGDNSDITDKDFYGAIDRFVTNTALAGLALIPCVISVFALPWRLPAMISPERGSGRDGILLAPGLFFLLSSLFSILVISLLTIATGTLSESAQTGDGGVNLGASDGVRIGSVDPTVITAAWQSGEYNAIVTTILPLFGLCVISFASTAWLKRFVGAWWTVRAAVRTGFYVFGALLGFSAIVVVLSFKVGLSDGQVSAVSSTISVLLMLLIPWVYYWVFKKGAQTRHLIALIASVLAPLTSILTMGLVAMLFS